MLKGQIIHALSGFYDVQVADKVYRTRARGNFRKKKLTPLVGDFIEFETTEENQGYILKLLARKNTLIRPPIANIDQAVIIVSAVEPDFSLNLLDRFLIYLESLGISGMIYLTKTDLIDQNTYDVLEEQLMYYQKIGYQTFTSKTVNDAKVLADLIATFKNKTTVFTGQTGAGKSTLLNQIDPKLNLKTAEISKSLNRGKHTTRHVELIAINDGLVGDTPGFSSLGILNVTLANLVSQFPEFVTIGQMCKFRTCQHINEPYCAVKQALSDGDILQSRYDNYLQFHAELSDMRPTYQKNKS